MQSPLKETWKYVLYAQLSFICRFKLYALFINEKNEMLFIDSDVFYRGAL
jgi:hypothetical protein